MNVIELKPRQALNRAFLKQKANRVEIENFKINLIQLLDRTNDKESEEFHKNLVIDFLKKTYYEPNYFINTKEKNDQVIHNGNNADSSVGVIIEAKKPTNKSDMVKTFAPEDTQEQMLAKLNVKSFQQLVLYYLRERITNKNLEVRHLVITNINEWFIFDAGLFDRLFAQNNDLVQTFKDFEGKRLAVKNTDDFYKQIAKPFIAQIQSDIEYTYFNLQDYQEPLRNEDKADDKKLITLFKLLSPVHLLKLKFANDSNSLDKGFYNELLHIVGLTEHDKKLIPGDREGKRHSGTILEDAMIQLDSLHKIDRLENLSQYGNTYQDRLFNVALELSITWINRILFLKLVEAQLITYHKGDPSYSFLNLNKNPSFGHLNTLFFEVLARKIDERNGDVKEVFKKVPYLNSSLFEPTEIEHLTLVISNLKHKKTIPIFSGTVLKNEQGKRKTGYLSTLEYLFEFLSAYDFSSEGSEGIQEESKTLINASVLGLIFEKINGYKDGSFFTPGFITMYMCRETVRKAIVQKFNAAKKWNCKNFEELVEDLNQLIREDSRGRKEVRKEANAIVNSIKICDPAVGSGHFLVSVLNELMCIKSKLSILADPNYEPIPYQINVSNDELEITDIDGEFFEYNYNNKESQRIQETLFYEKQTIIENCLFGVDINPNSVKICRLRLWIELLKNAYYKNATELETLPNIDINIKCGNSLISRFGLHDDLQSVFKSKENPYGLQEYKNIVKEYKHTNNKERKFEIQKIINTIKTSFKTTLSSKLFTDYNKKAYTYNLKVQELENLEKFGAKITENDNINLQELKLALEKALNEKEGIVNNIIYQNAFEWRFEFPEILNDTGDFVGFDVIIGNPPYFIMTKNNTHSNTLSHYLTTYQSIKNANSKNIFNLFIELGITIGCEQSFQSMIVPEGLFETKSYTDTVSLLQNAGSILNITRIKGMVFHEANTGNVIFIFGKNEQGVHPVQKLFDKNHDLLDFNIVINPIIKKIDNPAYFKLSDVCQLFKGMVVGDRKNAIFEININNLPDKFLLGNCISKWNIYKKFYTDYSKLSIIGGTKLKAKHDVFPRILIRRTGDFLCCAYLTEPALTESTLYSCWSINPDIHNLFVLGILHSKVADYYIKNKLVTNTESFPQILMSDLQALPIPKPTLELHDRIESLVELRLDNPENYSDLESQIDLLVYQLYDLTAAEIEIIENSLLQN